jgi:hypothetical protein
MKQFKTLFKLLVILLSGAQLMSCEKDEPQKDFITFEEIVLNSEGYWNGEDNSGGFTSGNAFFPNHFKDWGDGVTSWYGFACSNHTDTYTAGYGNQYSSWAGGGANGSEKYAVIYYGDTIEFTVPEKMESIQVSNSTYAALSMKDGDDFARKFEQGDYFNLVIAGIDEEDNLTGIIKIGLADYTAEDESMHYISNVWNLIELEYLGVVKKIIFGFESSDTGAVGINTPVYACIDNIKGTLQK